MSEPPAPDADQPGASDGVLPDPTQGEAAGVTPAATGFGSDMQAGSATIDEPSPGSDRPRKGPLSFLSGALTSGLLAWLCLGMSQRVVLYYAEHPPHYSAAIAQSIATAVKTLLVGMCFLATFSFGFIGLGLALTFLRSLLPSQRQGDPSGS